MVAELDNLNDVSIFIWLVLFLLVGTTRSAGWRCARLDCNDSSVCVSPLRFSLFFFFFFFCSARNSWLCQLWIVHSCTIHGSHKLQFSITFFIKNGSHNTIYTFKIYFATVFSVSIFSFSKNKLNPNRPLVVQD